MLEKIIVKIDSAGYKVVEFISSDSKRGKSAKSWQKISNLFPITPLLIIQLVLLTLVIWAVSTAAITLPYRDEPLVEEDKIFEEAPLQEKYVTVIPYYPLGVKYPNIVVGEDGSGDESIISEATEQQVLAPVIAETEPSATRG